MNDEIRRLLGGYATGTLSPGERDQLYTAALQDPELFAALADEQALKDLLDDSSARAAVLASLADRPFRISAALRDWFEKPKSRVMTSAAVLLLAAIAVREIRDRPSEPSAPRQDVTLRPASPTPQQPAPETPPLQARRNTDERQLAARRKQAQPVPGSAPGQLPPVPAAAAVPPASPSSPPPPPPAAVAQPVLSYTVLRVDPNGAAVPVASDNLFSPGERARIRVESQLSGMLLAKSGDEILYAGTISPELPVILKRDYTFSEPDVPAVDLEFAPGATVSPLTGSVALEAQGRAADGVVGGVPAPNRYAPQVDRPSLSAPEGAGRGVTPIRLRIQLRRK